MPEKSLTQEFEIANLTITLTSTNRNTNTLKVVDENPTTITSTNFDYNSLLEMQKQLSNFINSIQRLESGQPFNEQQ